MISKQELEKIKQRFKTIEVEFELIEKQTGDGERISHRVSSLLFNI